MLKVISEPFPAGPCGACGQALPEGEMWRGLRFDDFHELPQEVLSGAINFAPCQHCGYQASLWPGFLCFDARRARTIFATYDCNDIANAEAYRRLAARLQAEDLAFADLDSARPYVEVDDYRDIVGILGHDEELFELEAAYWQAFSERRGLSDLRARARRLLEQAESVPIIMFQGIEATSAFKSALTTEAQRSLEAPEVGERTRKIAGLWIEQARLHQSASGNAEEIDSGASDDPAERLDEARRARHVEIPGLQLPDEARTNVRDLLSMLADHLTASRTAAAPHLHELKRLLTAKAVDGLGVNSKTAAAPIAAELRESAAVLAGALGERQFGDPDDDILLSAETVVARAAAGLRRYQGTIFEIVHAELSRGQPATSLAALRFFTDVALLGGNLEAIIFAANLAATEETRAGRDRLIEHGAYALSLEAFAQLRDRGSAIAMEKASLIAFGVASQRVARYFQSLSLNHAAALVAGMAAFFFTYGGRGDGALTSRTDAAQFLLNTSSLSDTVLSTLIADLRAAGEKPEPPDSVRIDLARALLMRSRLEFQATEGRVLVAAIDGEIDAGEPVNESTIIAADGVVFGRDSVAPGREAAADDPLPAETPAEHSPAPEKVGGEADTPTAGSIDSTLIPCATLKRPGRPPLVVMATLASDWYATLGEVLTIAEEQQDQNMVVAVFSQLLDIIRTFEQPGLVRYFARAIQMEYSLRQIALESAAQFTLSLFEATAAVFDMRREGLPVDAKHPDLVEPVAQLDATVREAGGTLEQIPGIGRIAALIEVAEIFEAIGRHEAAATYFAAAAGLSIQRDESASQQLYRQRSARAMTLPVYRAARALAKANLVTPDPARAIACVELAEFTKARSHQMVNARPTSPHGTRAGVLPAADPFLADLPVRLSDLKDLCPTGSAVLFYSLLQETPLNDGFWFTALIDPGAGEVVMSRCTAFSAIYDPCQQVEKLFNQARGETVGRRLEDLANSLETSRASLDTALGDLADTLIPPEIAAVLADRAVNRLYILPEAYLYDVPWAALPVLGPNGRRSLCALDGPISLNILPNLSVLARRPKRRHSVGADAAPQAGAMLALDVAWRNDLAPIFGVRKRLTEALGAMDEGAEANAAPRTAWLSPNVVSFVSMMRSHLISLFFGHAEVGDHGSQLILDDGILGDRAIESASNMAPLSNEVALLMACSGINSVNRSHGREIAGIHMALVRGGIHCVVGSGQPLFPIVALKSVERALPLIVQSMPVDMAVEKARADIRMSPGMEHPLFWGHLLCFGDGSRRVDLATANADEIG